MEHVEIRDKKVGGKSLSMSQPVLGMDEPKDKKKPRRKKSSASQQVDVQALSATREDNTVLTDTAPKTSEGFPIPDPVPSTSKTVSATEAKTRPASVAKEATSEDPLPGTSKASSNNFVTPKCREKRRKPGKKDPRRRPFISPLSQPNTAHNAKEIMRELQAEVDNARASNIPG